MQVRAWKPTDRRRFDVRVPAEASEVQAVRHMLAELGLPARLLEEARLLLSELLTNSIRHSGLTPEDKVRVRAIWQGGTLRVDVWDRTGSSGSSPVAGAIRPIPGSESGWGLYLVDSLASRWGSQTGRYWFELEDDGGAGHQRQ